MPRGLRVIYKTPTSTGEPLVRENSCPIQRLLRAGSDVDVCAHGYLEQVDTANDAAWDEQFESVYSADALQRIPWLMVRPVVCSAIAIFSRPPPIVASVRSAQGPTPSFFRNAFPVCLLYHGQFPAIYSRMRFCTCILRVIGDVSCCRHCWNLYHGGTVRH